MSEDIKFTEKQMPMAFKQMKICFISLNKRNAGLMAWLKW
jgi:hypothetical protein